MDQSPSWEANLYQLVKQFPAFYGTRRFITAFTSARQLPLYWASPIQSTNLQPTSRISILIVSSHLRLGLPVVSFLRFPHQNPVHAFPITPIRVTCPAHLILLDFITCTIFGEQYRSLSSSLYRFLYSLVTPSLLGPNTLLNTLFSNTYVPPLTSATKFHTHTKQQAKLNFCIS